jgi:hypothetical protein
MGGIENLFHQHQQQLSSKKQLANFTLDHKACCIID